MSAIGTKRTSLVAPHMSAFGGRADMAKRADVLSAISSSYDRIIGRFYLPQRGLRQWRKFLNGYFHSESGAVISRSFH